MRVESNSGATNSTASVAHVLLSGRFCSSTDSLLPVRAVFKGWVNRFKVQTPSEMLGISTFEILMIKAVAYIAHNGQKDVATRCVLTAVKASKCNFAAGAPPRTHWHAPLDDSLSWIWEAERTGEGRGGKGLRKGSGERK